MFDHHALQTAYGAALADAAAMTFRYPVLQSQFNPRDGTGRYDCCATAGGMLADADSQGKLVFNHSQVRANTNEPVPDPASPGLHWGQVDTALFELSAGRVNLDVHPGGSPWSSVPVALRAGKWAGVAVQRSVLVDAGYGGGNGFRGAHAEVYGYDQDRHVYVMGDPLLSRWLDVPATVMGRAAERFLLSVGYGGGGAYYALTRDVYDAPPSTLKYSAVFAPGAFWLYTVSGGVIQSRVAKRFTQNTSAPCDAPSVYQWPGIGSRKLVRIQKGALVGRYVEPGSSHVTLKVSKVQ